VKGRLDLRPVSATLRYNHRNDDRMSVIEDSGNLLQDFLAPELRELTARIDALEERIDTRLKGVDTRFDSGERRTSEQHTSIAGHWQAG
jgi:hypothetical protein